MNSKIFSPATRYDLQYPYAYPYNTLERIYSRRMLDHKGTDVTIETMFSLRHPKRNMLRNPGIENFFSQDYVYLTLRLDQAHSDSTQRLFLYITYYQNLKNDEIIHLFSLASTKTPLEKLCSQWQ
jgi:hypothetical protein